ncbi:acyl-CoA N-acyltransferase [Lentinula detonsa]|uniref:Acyl-CoA N-acyltransferase n=2 Tax=Lentinula TaxID=5352 RepID=A0AA38KLS3_9AGAR|nr:acyl-CoA N-acyltransferase [Lentinula detonsa]KAJ3782039.1 acyl-CoA N-acyltransferase [Lentinula aff. detonsa]
MDVERKPLDDTVIIRPFYSTDSEQVLNVYFTGLVSGVDSAGYFAVTRAFLHWAPMYLAYFLSVSGGGTLLLALRTDIQILGLAIVFLSCCFMFFVYYRIRNAFLGYYQDGLRHDMTDISQYYRQDHEKDGYPIRRFWVAEISSMTSESGYEVVGCVALDCSLNRDEPMIGELKRLFVLPTYRKRGIGTKLMQTVIAFAKEQNITSLRLETTNFQPVAREMYTRLGWYHHDTRDSDFEAGDMKMSFVEYLLPL